MEMSFFFFSLFIIKKLNEKNGVFLVRHGFNSALQNDSHIDFHKTMVVPNEPNQISLCMGMYAALSRVLVSSVVIMNHSLFI